MTDIDEYALRRRASNYSFAIGMVTLGSLLVVCLVLMEPGQASKPMTTANLAVMVIGAMLGPCCHIALTEIIYGILVRRAQQRPPERLP